MKVFMTDLVVISWQKFLAAKVLAVVLFRETVD